jgi:hypothetical protein
MPGRKLTRSTCRLLALTCALVMSVDAAVAAHHSISAVYDSNQPVTIEGVVTEFHFVNPHPYLVIEGREPGGEVRRWHLEMDNRGELAAVGGTKETLRPGERVIVMGSRGRTERQSLYVRKLVRPADGFEYEQVGTSPRIRKP